MRLDRRRALSLLTFGAGAGAANVAAAREQARVPAVRFLHGVASGDPASDGAVVWTRATPPEGFAGRFEVTCEVSEGADFKAVTGWPAATGPERDFTVKLDARGLKPGRAYAYRFRCGDAVSPTGRFRTLPVGRTAKLDLAVVSCALFPAGFFNAYDHIARQDGLDAVVHLGDYYYEYGADHGGYGVSKGTPPERMPEPAHDIVTLADYRTRHAQYKRDPDLQAAHAAHAWIVVWDDHEVANDDWMHGAENHFPATEGPFDTRKAAALQAYYEWMPIREPKPGRAREVIQRSFDFGDLATLVMVETRLEARTQQVRTDDPDYPRAVYDASDPAKPVRVTDAAVTARVLAGVDAKRPAPAPYAVGPDLPVLNARLSAPGRGLLGAAQQGWVAAELKRSVASGRPWQVFASQVVMGRTVIPDLYKVLGRPRMDAMLAAASPAARTRLQRTAFQGAVGAPAGMDSWNGYPAAREALLGVMKAAGGNTVVVSGDSHSFWVNELRDVGGTRVAAEFGGTSVTSPSPGDSQPEFDMGAVMAAQNPEVTFSDHKAKGWLRVTFTRDLARGELIAVQKDAKPYTTHVVGAWTVKPTRGAGVGAVERVA